MWVIWIERNNRIFEDKVMGSDDLFEKDKYSASLRASTDKAFKDFPLSLIVLNWKDVVGYQCVSWFLFSEFLLFIVSLFMRIPCPLFYPLYSFPINKRLFLIEMNNYKISNFKEERCLH